VQSFVKLILFREDLCQQVMGTRGKWGVSLHLSRFEKVLSCRSQLVLLSQGEGQTNIRTGKCRIKLNGLFETLSRCIEIGRLAPTVSVIATATLVFFKSSLRFMSATSPL